MLQLIHEKAKSEGITNIQLIKVDNDHFNMEEDSVDIVLMVTVLHEINDNSVILEEVEKILKDDGKIVVIEFHKYKIPMGPPITHRLGKVEVEDILKNKGFTIMENFDLGNNFFCLVFARKLKVVCPSAVSTNDSSGEGIIICCEVK